MQPQNDEQMEEGLDGCLTIQPLHCSSGQSSTSSHSKASSKENPNSKLKPNRPKGVKIEHKSDAASVIIQHHPPMLNEPTPTYGQKPVPLPYSMVEGNSPPYYHHMPPSSFSGHSHFTPTCPGMMHSPMMPSPEYCFQLQISPGAHPQPQVGPQAYQVSPKLAHLSPGSGAFPNSTQLSPHPNPASYMYHSNPASPMQIAYSPAQPLMRVASTNNVYQHCNGTAEEVMHTIPVTYSDNAMIPQVHYSNIPSHPSPGYNEATAAGHYVPVPQPRSMFPAHHLPTLPRNE